MAVNITEDFEGGATGWTNNQTGTDGAFTEYLGGFGTTGTTGPDTEKTFDVSDGSGDVTITFDFYEIDSWDGETFNVFLGGEQVFAEAFVQSDSETASSGTTVTSSGTVAWTITPVSSGTANIGENAGFTDQIWTITLVISNPTANLTLGFGSSLDQDASDEAWGVDNLAITRPDANAVSIFEDFEGGATGWSNNATVTDAGFTQYIQLNETSSQPVATEKTFDVSAGEGDVTIEFDLYEIDDVDLDTNEDRFIVFVDGVEIFSLDFDGSGNDAARSGTTGDVSWTVTPVTDGSTNIGNAASTDQIHRVVLTVANPGNDVTLGFGETFDFNEEFYGIDNLSITRAAPSSDAVNDAVTVTEAEGPNDIDINVLANDTNAVAVALVNGDANNVGAQVAGSNGGLFTINANGDVDFDANGDFDGLNSGQSADTSVTYALDGSGANTATLTVTVDGQNTVVDAIDDALTVTESEGAGDTDGNVLANDTGDQIAVTEVNGAPSNVGSAVDGSNGGTFTINSDGTVDFDADGDFESLAVGESEVTTVEYTIRSPEPFVEGEQTVETSGDVGPSDQQAFFTLTAQELSNDGTTDLSGTIDLSGITQPTFNILFVMDVSGSTAFTNPSFPGAGDQNGDGDSNEVIDAEILALRQLSNEIDALGFSDADLDIGLVFFDNPGSQDPTNLIVQNPGGGQSFAAGSTALSNAINPGTNISGGTNFEAALDLAIDWFTGQPTRDNNIIYFLSDGEQSSAFDFSDEFATLTDPNGFNAQINAIGISSGASLTELNQLDNTGVIDPNDPVNPTGTAQRVDTLSQLNAALAPPFLDADVVDFRLFVDGVEDTSVDVNDLTQQGTGFSFDLAGVGGVTTDVNSSSTIIAEVEFDDGTILSNTLVVGTPAEDTATVTVTVTGVNDAPVALDDAFTGDEDTAITGNVLDNDGDIDGDNLTAALGTGPANGNVTVNPDGTFEYTPDPDFNGTDTFTYIVSDGNGGSDLATVTITVAPVNDAPVAQPDTVAGDEDSPITGNVLDNDNDVDGDPLTATLGTPPANGTVVVNPDGSFEYTADPDFNGTDTFTYIATDPSGATSVETVTVTVNPVNDAPVAQPDTVAGDEDSPITGNVLDNDNDVDGDPLTASLGTPPSNGTVVVNPDGSFEYTPDPDFNGTDEFTYVATDPSGETSVETVTITVNPVNDAPVAQPDTVAGNEDSPITGNVLDNDSDVDGDPLTASLGTPPANGTVVVNPDGSFEYTPDPDFNGTDTFTYIATDPSGATSVETVTVTVNPVNDAPVATDDQVSTDEDSALTIPAADLFANDNDVDGDTLILSAVDSGNTTGVVQFGPNEVTYDPNGQFEDLAAGETAIDTFTYTVTDGQGGFDTATVTVVINGVNDAPVAQPDAVTGDEDSPITGNVLTNDDDVDGDPLTASLGTPPANGTVVVNPDGSFEYTPDPDFNGTDTFTYIATDPSGETSVETVTVTVNPVNDAPVASPDAVTGDEDTPITGNVLDNDVDVDGDPLTATLQDAPANGQVTLNPDGSFEYTPDPDFNGTDEFTYVVSDGQGGSALETVTITVDPVNDAPVAQPDAVSGDEDTPITGNVLDNDNDVDGDPLTATLGTPPSNGTVVVNPDGTFEYTPDPDFNGTDEFTYVATDPSGETSVQTVTITVNSVNDAPVAVDDTASVGEGGIADIDVLGNDSDVDGGTLTILGANANPVDTPFDVTSDGGRTGVATIAADGTTQLNFDTNGDFEDLAVGETDTVTVTYILSDGQGGTDIATVTITIDGENDAPVAQPDFVSGLEDNPITGNVLSNDEDVDGDALTATLQDAPTNGDVVLNPNGTFTYTPDPDFVGEDIFTYVVDDGNGGTAVETVTVRVGGDNDAPEAADDTVTVSEDGTTTIPGADLLANDSDVDGDTLTVISVNDAASTGIVTLNGGDVVYDADGQFEDLAVGETAIDTFSYTVSDGNGGTDTATVTVIVEGVNDAPETEGDEASGVEDTPITGNVLTNDQDVDGDPLTATLGTPPANGDVVLNPDGSFTYTPDADFNGTDTFTYVADDGNGGTVTETVTITVTPVNDAPVAADDTVTTDEDTPLALAPADLLGNDDDVDGDALVITAVDDSATTGSVSLDATGVTYDPDGQFDGLAAGESAVDTFTYTISDGQGGFDTATVTVTVTGVNDAPVAVADTAAGLEDQPITGNVLTNDVDVDGDPLTASLGNPPANGDVVVNPDGSFTYTPDPDFNGTDEFTYIVDDGQGGTDTEIVTITVGAVNDVPVAADDTVTTDEDTPLPISAAILLANDVDADNDTLTITAVGTANTTGSVQLNAGQVVYDPSGQFDSLGVGESAVDTFTYTVSDGNGGFDTATVTVTVTGVNDAPEAVADSASGLEDTVITGNVLDNDSDEDGDTLTATLGDAPQNGTVVLNPDGSFEYTPDTNFAGVDTFTYVVSDGNGGTDTETVTISVGGDNDAPELTDDAVTTDEDTALTIPTADLLANDSDPENDPLVVTAVGTAGTTGDVQLNGTEIVYDPNGQFEDLAVGESAVDTFTYTVSDGNGGFSTATVTVTINGVNDAPVAQPDFATGDEDTPITGSVLDNDSDVDGDPLTATLGTPPANGDVVLNPDGTFEYTPDPDFNGTDTFTYVVDDGNGGTVVETVTVTVNPVNDAPVAAPDAFTGDEDTPITGNVLDNDVDVDGDPLTATLGTPPANGTVVVNPDGSFEYTPDPDFNGTDEFTYVATDPSGETSVETVTITVNPVNDAPVAQPDTVTGDEDTPITGNVLDNDGDVDGDPLTATLDTPPTNGTVVLNPDGSFEYTPDPDFNGTDTFTYVATDPSGETSVETVTVNVTPVNDPPVAVDDELTFDSESFSTVITPDANDIDVDGDDLTVLSFDGSGLQGTIQRLGPNTDELFYDTGTAFNSLAEGETAIETFTYVVADPSGASDVGEVSITITGENDGPTAVADSATVGEDDTGSTTIDLTVNDIDPDASDDLEIDSVDTSGTLGTVLINADNDTVEYDPNGAFEFLAEGESAVDTFTYTVTDPFGATSSAAVSVTVIGSNDAPEAVDDTASVLTDGTVDINVLDNDLDVDEDPLAIQSVDDTGLLGTVTINDNGTPGDTTDDFITYDPNGAFDGLGQGESAVETFSYTAVDPSGVTSTATVTVTIFGVNDAPTAEDDTATVNQGQSVDISVLANDVDPNAGDVLSVIDVTDGANGTVVINPDGTVTYTPDRQFPNNDDGIPGTDTFTYTISDGRGGESTASVVVTVNANIPPFIPEPIRFDAPENQLLAADLQAVDIEFDPVTFSIAGTGDDDALFEIVDPVNGILNFRNAPDFETPLSADGDNEYFIDITVSDEFGSRTQTIEVNVTDVDDTPNTPPTIVGPEVVLFTTIDEGILPLTQFVADDLDGDTLQFTLFGQDANVDVDPNTPGIQPLFTVEPINGFLILNQRQTDPRGSFDGDSVYEVDILVEDGEGGSDVLSMDLILITGA